MPRLRFILILALCAGSISWSCQRGKVAETDSWQNDTDPSWTVRLVDGNGLPYADRQVQLMLRTWQPSGTWTNAHELGTYPTDAEGQLTFPYPWALEGDPGEVEFTVRPTDGLRGGFGAASELPQHEAGDHDFGTLPLLQPTFLASGKIVDESGLPIDAFIYPHELLRNPADPDAGATPEDAPLRNFRGEAASDFHLTGVSRSDEILLSADGPGFARKEVRIKRGTEGLVIRLTRDYGFEGKIQLPEGLDPRRVWIRFLPDGRDPSERNPYLDRASADGSFRIDEIPPQESGTLIAEYRTGRIPLATLQDQKPTLLADGPTPDLVPWIIPDLQEFHIELLGAEDEVLEGLIWELLEAPGATSPIATGGDIYFDGFRFLWKKEQAHMRLFAPGYRLMEATLVPGTNRIEAVEGQVVHLRVEGLPKVSEGMDYRLRYGHKDGPALLEAQALLPAPEPDGSFRLAFPLPGDYWIAWAVVDQADFRWREIMDGEEPWRGSLTVPDGSGIQGVTVQAPTSEIEAAISILLEPGG